MKRPLRDAENRATPLVVHAEGERIRPDTSRELYPLSTGCASASDPTYGKIPRAIQWRAYELLAERPGAPVRLAQLVATEHTLNDDMLAHRAILDDAEPAQPATWRQRIAARFYADEHSSTLRVGGTVFILFAVLVTALVCAGIIVLLHGLGLIR